jgi:hypothetical protein
MEGFDPKAPSQGLGDVIAKITHATGLDVVADKVAKAMGQEDCGCNKRREKLNELIPFKQEKSIVPVLLPTTFIIKRNLAIQQGTEVVRYAKEEKVYITEDHPLAQSLNYFLKVGAVEVEDKNMLI